MKGENQDQTQARRTIENGDEAAHFERAVSNWHNEAKREIQATRYRKLKIGANIEALSHAPISLRSWRPFGFAQDRLGAKSFVEIAAEYSISISR